FTVTLRREGYLDSSFQIQNPNGSNYYKSRLREKPGILSLKAISTRTGKAIPAKVYLNDMEKGKTPWSGPIPPETKTIALRSPGYQEHLIQDRPKPRNKLALTIKLDDVDTRGMGKVKTGCFEMGNKAGKKNENPVHKVCLKHFLLDFQEVTQKQYHQVMGEEPSFFAVCGQDCPVESISWKKAKTYCEKLGKRLPTEAEWEYAARAGSNNKWGCGILSVCLGSVAWTKDNSNGRPHPVRQKKSNDWGFFDMQGNVAEWTADWYGDTYYAFSPKQNPKGANGGVSRVVRGGSWAEEDEDMPISTRGGYDPSFRETMIGFRCAADVKE
ncbi:MAG TPA: SUMF1/EgtB/PvdO family nonheme iron enzyme, partial [Fibrobacteraceae bacterium]|nr:SUMF1/EgtB/PvdO family nonheme iron enzyme [Fibrobacteraceae bacterium]